MHMIVLSWCHLLVSDIPPFEQQSILFKLELEKQKIQEEQENAPEFVKVKGNLRRTVQESAEAPNS